VKNLAQLYMHGVIDIFADRPRLTSTVPERPAATPLARYQASRGASAINRAHRGVPLEKTDRLILMACTGERDAAGLLVHLAALPKEELLPNEPGKPIERESDARAFWQRHVPTALQKLTAAGFF